MTFSEATGPIYITSPDRTGLHALGLSGTALASGQYETGTRIGLRPV